MSVLSSGSDLCHADIVCAVHDSSQVGEARRLAITTAKAMGFSDTDCGKAALIVAEGATNLIKHAGSGAIVFRRVNDTVQRGLVILILDKGPGMSHPDKCMRDGFSTTDSPGTGLGAISRLSDEFDLFTAAGCGCALVSRLWGQQAALQSAWRTGAVCIPKPGEKDCGDAWAMEESDTETTILVVDALGHGTIAAQAAQVAVQTFRAHHPLDAVALLQRIHESMRPTRGAAAAVAKIKHDERKVRFVGVGNISASIHRNDDTRSMVSHNGTVGGEARKFQEFVYDLPRGALLVFHSDGIATRWRLGDFPGLAFRDPGLVAGVLYQNYLRGRDDATVVVMSERGVGPS